jgi:hypothetical protein
MGREAPARFGRTALSAAVFASLALLPCLAACGGSGPPDIDLVEDPEERRPGAARRFAPQALAALKRRLQVDEKRAESWEWRAEEPVKLDRATRSRLRELGYMQVEAPEP